MSGDGFESSNPSERPETAHTLADVRLFYVDQSVIDFTVRFLAEVGRQGFEGLVLWGGRRTADDHDAEIVLAVAPQQHASRGEDGVLVTVDGEELFRVNVDFYGRGLLLCAQVHSHPTEAYHSDTDDAFAVITIPGGLSLVLPWFAREGLDADTTAVYRLSTSGEWLPIPPENVLDLLVINAPGDAGPDDSTSSR